MRLLLSLLLLIIVTPASAQVYKCRLPNGQTEITNKPCQGSTVIEVRPEEKVSEAERRATERGLQRARAFLEKREAELRARRRKAEAAGEPASRAQPAANPEITTGASGRADDCLRELAQLVLDDGERSRREGECRRLPESPALAPSVPAAPAPVAAPLAPPPVVTQPSGRPPKEVEPSIPRLLPESPGN